MSLAPRSRLSFVAPGVVGGAFAIAFAYFALCVCKVVMVGDARVYIGGAHALYEDFWHPQHESVVASKHFSFAFTPYLYVLAAVGRLLGVSGYGAVQLAAIANLTLYLSGMVAFFRALVRGPAGTWAALFFLVTSLFLRDENAFWSSETSVRSLTVVLGYPSTFAWGALLWSLAQVEWFLVDRRPHRLVWLLVLVWFVLLSHPLTGSLLFGLCGLRALLFVALGTTTAPHRTTSWRDRARTAGLVVLALVLGALLTLLWPDASFLNPALTLAKEDAPFAHRIWETFALAYWAAIPALVFLVRRDRVVVVLVANLLAAFGVYWALRAAGVDYASRYVLFTGFAAHALVALMCGVAVVASTSHPSVWVRWSARAYVVAVLVASFSSPMVRGGDHVKGALQVPVDLWAAPWAEPRFYAAFDDFKGQLHAGDVVMCSDDRNGMLLFPITGARSVTARFTTQLPDFKQRTRAARVFFSPTVSRAQRMGAAGQFHASHALAVKPSDALLAALTRDLGPPLVHTDTFTLYRIPHGDVPVTSSPSALPDDVPSGVTDDAHSDP
jgi:hypothetical protein